MRILFYVDGRSPTALNWIRYFTETEHEVHLVSSYPAAPDLELASFHVTPAAFSEAAGQVSSKPGIPEPAEPRSLIARLLKRFTTPRLRTIVRRWLAPLTLGRSASGLRQLIEEIQPDLVHAMRIPYEGMVAATAIRRMKRSRVKAPPLMVSVWGNDFTLHAPATPFTRRLTHMTLQTTDGLHTDCYRDQRLAQSWGFEVGKPAIVLPGGGGIPLDLFHLPDESDGPGRLAPPPVIVNPRGLRAYVRNDTFFQSIPIVLQSRPDARFLCPAMENEPQALRWLDQLHLHPYVSLLPKQSRAEMANLFKRAQVVVSPTTHDGTPNTILEAMACGALPVVGDLESLREWITAGVNGMLIDPEDPQALGEAVVLALEQDEFREKAAEYNFKLIQERAARSRVMPQAEDFYADLVGGG